MAAVRNVADGSAGSASKLFRAASMETAMESHSDSKLKYLIAFGIPVVAGAALYWYLSRRKSNPKLKAGKGVHPSKRDARVEAERKIEEQICSSDFQEKATGYKNKGNNYFRLKKYQEAIECYSNALKVCPLNLPDMLATFYHNRAAAFENLKMIDNVIDDCTKAIDLNNKYAKAYFRRAKALEQRGEMRKCLEDALCCLVVEDFKHESAFELFYRVFRSLGSQLAKELCQHRSPQLPSPTTIRDYFATFLEDPVVTDLKAHKNNVQVNSDENNSSGGYEKALQALRKENFDAVSEYCRTEISSPRDEESANKALLLLATLSILAAEFGKARKILEEILAKFHVDVKIRVNALVKRAIVDCREQLLDSAFQSFSEAENVDPNNADIFFHRGLLYIECAQVHKGLQDFELALTLRPDFASAAIRVACIQYKCGVLFNVGKQQQDGTKNLEQCLKKFPQCAEVHLHYAQLMMEMDEFDVAENHFKKATALDPRSPIGFVQLGLFLFHARNDIDAAIALSKKAIEVDPKYWLGYETLAVLFMRKGDLDACFKLLNESPTLHQTEVDATQLVLLKTSAELLVVCKERFRNKNPVASAFLHDVYERSKFGQ